MAIARDIPVTRPQIYGWYTKWYNTIGKSVTDPDERKASFKAYLEKQITALKLSDEMVNTTGHDQLPDETHIVDMIMADLPSYTPPPDSIDAPQQRSLTDEDANAPSSLIT